MARRSNIRASNIHSPITASPAPLHHDPHSDNLASLRRQWRWAAFSQFFYTFSPLFAMHDVGIVDVERDLTQGTSVVLPRVMQKLLYTLSYDRKVSVDNWQTTLRKQYNRRNPEANPIGPDPKDIIKETEELEFTQSTAEILPIIEAAPKEGRYTSTELAVEPASRPPASRSRQSSVTRNSSLRSSTQQHSTPSIDWFDLPMLSKLESMHTLAEWQFQNPMRLRSIMKTDDEAALWRIEPIGYDSKRNAYWLIGGDRLWIQRMPPKPAKAKGSKRKRASEKEPENLGSKVVSTPAKRPRLNIQSSNPVLTPPGRHSRAAKDQAKLKLDVQAKELAELNRAAFLEQKPRTLRQKTPHGPPRSFGTRTSARLRGVSDGDWQSIPDEWLDVGEISDSEQAKSKAHKTGLESDEDTISDLTELSEAVSEGSVETPLDKGELDKDKDGVMFNELKASTKEGGGGHDFVEWETICTYIHEWEQIVERFETATHYSEKALYKTLANDIVPAVTHQLREVQQKRELEEALIHRKRSSRLAVRESEREEARLAAKRKEEDAEKNSRARRMEVRLQKEELDRVKRENAREQRRKEREAREKSRKGRGSVGNGTLDNQNDPKLQNDVATTASNQKLWDSRTNGTNGTHSGSRTPAGEDWELSCEICCRQGINLDDGTPMMSCGRCSKWQHIFCHDGADQAAGRPPRNWDFVDFICKSCHVSQQGSRRDYPIPIKQQPLPSAIPQVHAYQPYPPQPPMNHSLVDLRPSAHSPPYKDPAPQSFYVRPSNGQQLNMQSSYSALSSVPPTRPAIAFNHYQPAPHGYSYGAHKSYSDAHYSYNHSNQQYNQVVSPSYKPQNALSAAWNITTPAHAPGYGGPHIASGSISGPTSYSRGAQSEHQYDELPHSQPSFAGYSPEQHYSSTQFKHHSASYQPPLGR